MSLQEIQHEIEPVYDRNSRILILGTMPSPKSRQSGFFYMHPQNRFWKVIPALLDEPVPQTNEARRALLLHHGIALWDVLSSCRIDGADDASIQNPVPNDFIPVLAGSRIQTIFTTGTKAFSLYRKLCLPVTGIEAIPLPSTSPANCRHYTYEKLLEAYRVILQYLNP